MLGLALLLSAIFLLSLRAFSRLGNDRARALRRQRARLRQSLINRRGAR